MSKMISVASGFQYSVNIGFDLGNDEKLKNFIPTKSALSLLEEVLLSTVETSTERSRVLIGAYGKGKSHIVLTILSILLKRDLGLFEKMLPKLEEHPRIKQCVLNYYDSKNKILPVVISGSNTSLSQAFLLALQRTLSDNDLLDVMPETNYKAAISVIERWKTDFPDTYRAFEATIDAPVSVFVGALDSYDIAAYEQFERVYPTLTAGSIFNPFLGFDVIELYESVAKELHNKGYTGIYVVYDEFSKFLEANITEASFIEQLAVVYAAHIIEAEKGANTYDFIANAMKRWVMSLPKYAKEIKTLPNGKRIESRHLSLLKLLKQNTSSYELLFDKLPKAFGYTGDFSAGLADNIVASKQYIDGLVDSLKKALITQTKQIFMLPQNESIAARMSLVSTIKEWCDSISPSAFSHIFSDGTDKCLALFNTVTNDEDSFIVRLAKTATGLRIEDWDDRTINTYTRKLKQYKQTAESYAEEVKQEETESASNYKVTFVEADGSAITKSFERVEYSNRGKLLYNQITQSLDSMGHAISEQEKRQVIMEILRKLC